MLHALKRIGITILISISILMLLPWVLSAAGYYVNSPGWKIGELAAKEGNVRLCRNIITYFEIFGPVAADRRSECVYTYASLTKDPTACELLMPSSYGLSCVGGGDG